jgi:DNA repair photolyase
VKRLADAGVDVGVSLSPIIPGLNDEDIPRVLEAARDAGAKRAFWGMVRLPGPVKDVFEERLRATLPLRAERVLHRLREVRGGELNDARFGSRMRGEGLYAEAIKRLFDATARRLGLNEGGTSDDDAPEASTFRRPVRPQAQLSLF